MTTEQMTQESPATDGPHLQVVPEVTSGDEEVGTRHSVLDDTGSVGVTPRRSAQARARGNTESNPVPTAEGDRQADDFPADTAVREADAATDGAAEAASVEAGSTDVEADAETRRGRVGPALRAAGARLGDGSAWSRLGRVFIPPKLITERRPSLKEQWHYARWGEHLPRDGVFRVLAIVYGIAVSLPTSCLAYLYEWVWERPTRALATFVLFGVLAQVPYVAPLVRFLGTVATYPITVWF